MTELLSEWNEIIETAGLIAIIGLALCTMVRAVRLADVPKHLAFILATAILLIMLPAIMVGLWKSMSFVHHLSIIVLAITIAVILSKSRGRAQNLRRK